MSPVMTCPELSPTRRRRTTPSISASSPARRLPLAGCRRSQTSAESVVLQRDRCTEQRHDAVAGELVDRPAVALDNRRATLDQFGHDLAQPLRADVQQRYPSSARHRRTARSPACTPPPLPAGRRTAFAAELGGFSLSSAPQTGARACHRLGHRDMSFEAKRFRHLKVATRRSPGKWLRHRCARASRARIRNMMRSLICPIFEPCQRRQALDHRLCLLARHPRLPRADERLNENAPWPNRNNRTAHRGTTRRYWHASVVRHGRRRRHIDHAMANPDVEHWNLGEIEAAAGRPFPGPASTTPFRVPAPRGRDASGRTAIVVMVKLSARSSAVRSAKSRAALIVAHCGVVGEDDAICYRHAVGIGHDHSLRYRVAVLGHRQGVKAVFSPAFLAQHPPCDRPRRYAEASGEPRM